ncbi:MAG: alpha-amylase, partial [Chloroflexi bacterium]
DVEIARALGERGRFPYAAALAAHLEYQPTRGEAATIGVLQGFVPNEGDAWTYALDALGAFWERVLTYETGDPLPRPTLADLLDAGGLEPPPVAWELIEPFLSAAQALGQRTAELHVALASISDPAFAPEPFTMLYQRSVYQGLRGQIDETWRLLRQNLARLDPATAAAAERLLPREDEAQRVARRITAQKLDTVRIRTHGDYHLGQVLFTGSDFVIIDFEGEPASPLSQRRLKRSPVHDIAGMVRSFDYAAWISYANAREQGLVPQERAQEAAEWARFWSGWVALAFVRSYLATAGPAPFIPQTPAGLATLFELALLTKVAYELRYELNNRPNWAWAPLNGLLDLLDAAGKGATHGC